MYSIQPANRALRSTFPHYAAGESLKANPRQDRVLSVRSQVVNEIHHLKNVLKAKRALEDWNSRPRVTSPDITARESLAASCAEHQAIAVKAELKKAMNTRASIERQIADIRAALRD